MYIWIKHSDVFGYAGISQGQSEADINNHMDEQEILKFFEGTRVVEMLEKDCITNLPEGFVEYMESIGWKEEKDMYRVAPYGMVYAYCFSKQE